MKKFMVFVAIFALAIFIVACGTAVNQEPAKSTAENTAENSTPKPTDSDDQTRDFEPGVILLTLNEKQTGSVESLFPELNIESAEDVNQKAYDRVKDDPELKEQADAYAAKIGTDFIVTLSEKTKDAVTAGIELIKDNSLVKSATPNYIMEPTE